MSGFHDERWVSISTISSAFQRSISQSAKSLGRHVKLPPDRSRGSALLNTCPRWPVISNSLSIIGLCRSTRSNSTFVSRSPARVRRSMSAISERERRAIEHERRCKRCLKIANSPSDSRFHSELPSALAAWICANVRPSQSSVAVLFVNDCQRWMTTSTYFGSSSMP